MSSTEPMFQVEMVTPDRMASSYRNSPPVLHGRATLEPAQVRRAIIHWVSLSREAFDVEEMMRTGKVRINRDCSAELVWEER